MQSLWLPAIRRNWRWTKRTQLPLTARSLLPPSTGANSFVNNVSCLYHVIVRGEHTWQPTSSAAAAEFRRFSTIAASSGTAGRERWRIWSGSSNALQSRTAQGADADAAASGARRLQRFPHPLEDADPTSHPEGSKAEYANCNSLRPRRIRQERIVKLRDEIVQISEANKQYVQGGKKIPAHRIMNVDFRDCRNPRRIGVVDDWKKL